MYIMLAYLMLSSALFDVVYLYNASFLSLIFANEFFSCCLCNFFILFILIICNMIGHMSITI